MADYINKLPDDIFCYILSLLTIRDTFRVKSLSSRWKDLPDCRSVIRFDAYTILGEVTCDIQSIARRSKFIKAIDQFLKIWTAQKTSALKIKFDLGNKYASHINGWIASVCGKGIEELDLDFSFHVRATEVSIKRRINYGGLSPVLSDLAREVPRLETLSLWVNSEVQPLPPNVTMSCLKRLDLFADIPIGFNLCTITNLLYASPVLQELSLKVIPRGRPYVQPPQQQFEDRPHFHLKEVKFSGVLPVFSAMELMEYLLRNGVSLQQMIFIVGAEFSPICRGHPKFTMLQNVNPTVELIFI